MSSPEPLNLVHYTALKESARLHASDKLLTWDFAKRVDGIMKAHNTRVAKLGLSHVHDNVQVINALIEILS